MRNIFAINAMILALMAGSCNDKNKPVTSTNEEQKDTIPEEPGKDTGCFSEVTETKFEIRGGYGCIAFIPYNLTIHQKGQSVTYTFNGKERVMDYEQFRRFWKVCSSIDLCRLGSSYGMMETTADFRGDLTIEVTNGKEIWSRKIQFIKGEIGDKRFKELIDTMMKLVDKDERLPEL
jgi:hypothetical protein